MPHNPSAEEQLLAEFRRELGALLQEDASVRAAPAPPPQPDAAPRPRPGPNLTREQEMFAGRRAPAAAPVAAAEQASPPPSKPTGKFVPLAPASLAAARLTEGEVEPLIVKFLARAQRASGAAIARQTALPYALVDQLLQQLKQERLLTIKSSGTMHDYLYEITELGLEHGRRLTEQCAYCGAAPVALEDYVASVAAQSIARQRVRPEDVRKALADLTLGDEMESKVGRAVRSGKGLFLYGSPGNGKTSIAERITRAYGLSIWIPRAISAFGEIIRLFDPSNHAPLPLAESSQVAGAEQIDQRWVRIQRPTIVAGGELTLDALDLRLNPETGVAEAPLQLKANCGTLVIDDFGRQRVAPADLLNRWIVPLEKRYDFLTLRSGRKIQVPFDEFVVFSTNLEPRQLVDEAFLRRIPYKVDVCDPTEAQFRALFARLAAKLGLACAAADLDYLIERYYRAPGRAMRFCHPRDLLHQIGVYCDYLGAPPAVSRAAIDAAASDYFSVV